MNPLTALTQLSSAQAAQPSEAKPSAETLKVAREFEGIFLRTLLAPLEKATKMGGGSPMQAGQSAHGGMVVGAMADSMTASGGIGLAEVIAKAMTHQQNRGKSGPEQP